MNMYGIFSYIYTFGYVWSICMVNIGKYNIPYIVHLAREFLLETFRSLEYSQAFCV